EEGADRAIMSAGLTGAPLYVVPVSAKQAVEQIAAARDRGLNVFGETCPQYLYLSLEEQLGASSEEWGDFEGAKWVCSTPLRSRAEGIRTTCGSRCAPTTSRWCRPTTAPSA